MRDDLYNVKLERLGKIIEQKKCVCEANCGGTLSVIESGQVYAGTKLYFTNAILDDESRVVEVHYIQDGMVNGHTSLSKPMEIFAKKWLTRLGLGEDD